MGAKFNLGILITAKDQASGVIGTVGKNVQANAATFRKVGGIATAAGGAILGSLALITKGVAKTGDELAKASAKTGVTVESLSRLRFAAEQSGIGFSELEMALARQSRAASEASQGVAEYADTYKALGVSVTDGNGQLKDGEVLFRETAEALAKIENPTQRAALAMDIFGRSGANMLPLLNQGAKGIDDLGKRAHELGIVFDADAAKASERFNDTLNEVKLSLGGAAKEIATVVMPVVSDLAEKVGTVVGKFSAWAKEHPGLTKGLTLAAGAGGTLLGVVGPLLIMLPSLSAGWGILTGALGRNAVAAEGAAVANLGAGTAAQRAAAMTQRAGAIMKSAWFGVGISVVAVTFLVGKLRKMAEDAGNDWEMLRETVLGGDALAKAMGGVVATTRDPRVDQALKGLKGAVDEQRALAEQLRKVKQEYKELANILDQTRTFGIKSDMYQEVGGAAGIKRIEEYMMGLKAQQAQVRGNLQALNESGIIGNLREGVTVAQNAAATSPMPRVVRPAQQAGAYAMAGGASAQGERIGRVKFEFPAGTVLVAAEELMRLPRVQEEVHKIIGATARRVPGQHDF